MVNHYLRRLLILGVLQLLMLSIILLSFQNHNFQSGQELVYNPLGGTRIGIATTSYTTGEKDVIMEVDNLSGSGVKNNGIGQPIAVTGVATVLVPPGPTTQLFNDVVGTGATNGEGVVIDVIVTYDPQVVLHFPRLVLL